MGEIVDEVSLEPVKLQHLLIVNKNNKYPQQDEPHKDGKHQNHQPGLGGQNLIGIQVGLLYDIFQPRTDLHIPVDIEKQGKHESNNRKNKDSPASGRKGWQS